MNLSKILLPWRRRDLFRLAYADPPWRFKNWSMGELAQRGEKWGRATGRPIYPVMTTEDICRMPVGELMARHSILLLWATAPKMEDAFKVMRAWGFKYKTIVFDWIKLNPSGRGWHFGMGYHTHRNAEYVLLGTRGNGCKRLTKDVFSLVTWPRGLHSAKPPIVRDRIERLYGRDLFKIELFARQGLQRWETWGNQCPQSPYASILENYLIPPIEAIVDEDEYQGLPVEETVQTSWDDGEQMLLF